MGPVSGQQIMYVYTDHNFLLNCIGNATWRNAVINAHRSSRITVVLSAWHFYEYANGAAYPDTEDLIQFAEALEPMWILERADLQLHEFVAVWNAIWDGAPLDFNPIHSLAEASAILNRVPVERMARYTIRDYVQSFSAPGALDEIRAVMKAQTEVARSNLDSYLNDKRWSSVYPLTELMYVAVQVARLKSHRPATVYTVANELLRQQPIATQIECFAYWRCTELLKAYKTEVAFTLDLYPNRASLDGNRQIDRCHAIPALSYCDTFVTDDGDLTKRCIRVKPQLRFPTAKVITIADFMGSL